MKKTLTIITLLIMILGTVFAWLTLFDNELNSLSDDIQIETDEELTYVTVDEVKLETPGYVAIREFVNDEVGQMIEVSKYLEAGVHKDVHIDVSYVEGDYQNGIALLYLDNGDKGFSPIASEIAFINNDQPVARFVDSGDYVSSDALRVLTQSFSNENLVDVAQEVSYTNNGFVPETVSISEGDTVRFTNNSDVGMWVASDEHPQHTILSTFDQFGIAEDDEVYEYTFEKQGTWAYHDHIDASKLGTVIVE